MVHKRSQAALARAYIGENATNEADAFFTSAMAK
jgi:hypothetical protein